MNVERDAELEGVESANLSAETVVRDQFPSMVVVER